MNWLAKINFTIVFSRLGTFRSAIILVLVLSITFYCGYRLGNFYHGYQAKIIKSQENRLNNLYKNLAQKTQQNDTLAIELEMEKLANTDTQKTLKSLEQSLFQANKKLAFYKKIMAPEKQADGLVIDKLTIEKTSSDYHYRFQLILVQQLIRKRYPKGHITFSISGSINGQPTTLSLEQISLSDKADLSFSFQYFQNIEGEFILPKYFIAEKINMIVTLPKSKWQKFKQIKQSFDWRSVILD